MIRTINWAKAEIERIRLDYERYAEEAESQQISVLKAAGRENLKALEERLQEPYRIIGALTCSDNFEFEYYCTARRLIEAIDKALQPNS